MWREFVGWSCVPESGIFDNEFDFHPNIILKEAKVLGVFGRVVWQTWWQVRAMLDTGKFDPLPIITHRFPLADYEKAFELAQSGEAGKTFNPLMGCADTPFEAIVPFTHKKL